MRGHENRQTAAQGRLSGRPWHTRLLAAGLRGLCRLTPRQGVAAFYLLLTIVTSGLSTITEAEASVPTVATVPFRSSNHYALNDVLSEELRNDAPTPRTVYRLDTREIR